MVRGPSPGPAPACQARASNSRLTRSSWDVAPPEAAQEGARWRLDRAAQGACATHRRRQCSRPQPARKRPRQHLVPSPVPALRRGQGDGRRVPAGPGWPEGAARHRSAKVICRSGWLRGSIYWVLLFRGRFFATKPLSQIQRSTLWLLGPQGRPSVDSGLGSTEAAWDTFSEPYRSQWRPPSDGEVTENTFLGAGFSDIRASASFDFFSTTEDIAFLHTFISDWFYSPDVIAEATKYRLATQQQFDDWCLALDQWKSHAGALAEGEGIAFKT